MAATRRLFSSITLAAAGLALLGLPSHAQQATGPGKPVRIVVSAAAGSTPDVVARLMGQKMSERWQGSPVVVDNKPGALSAPAVDNVANSPADGSTIMFTDNATWAITPHIVAKPPFDAQRDLQPIAQVLVAPTFLVVATKVPVTSVAELIDYARKNPGKLTYGSPGIGSPHQLAAEMMKQLTGTDILHVPYKGVVQMATALMAGEIDIAFMGYTAAQPAVQKGAAKIYGVAAEQRIPNLASIPTMQELGVKGLVIATTMGFFGPANLPRDMNARFAEAAAAALQSPEVTAKFQDLGLVPALVQGDAFATAIRGDLARYGDLIKRANIKAE